MSNPGQQLKALVATIVTAAVCCCAVLWLFPNHQSNDQINWNPVQTEEKSDSAKALAAEMAPHDQSAKILAVSDSTILHTAESAMLPNQSANPSADQRIEFDEQDLAIFAALPPICTEDLKLAQTATPPTVTAPPAAAAPTASEPSPPAASATSVNSPADLEPATAVQPTAATIPSQVQPTGQTVSQVSYFEQSDIDSGLVWNIPPEQLNAYFEQANELANRNQFDPHVQSASGIYNPHAAATSVVSTNHLSTDEDPHLEIYSRSPFPSAKDCATCHQQIYEEWAASSHAYAAVSPMFHVFEDTINRLSQGTIGYFCYRCHAPVATTMGLRRDQPIYDGPRVFREGVTCVACHRVKTPYGKVDGERRIEPGDIYDPVYGGSDGTGVSIADKYQEFFKVKTDRHQHKGPGQAMHRRSIQFEELSKSTFCVSCHQVAVEPGIKLEVVWDQYRASPAYRDGVTCQDCHMGRIPGVDEGYSIGPAAIVNDRVVNPERKHSNHVFYGPGYSIAHPGVFPDNLKADRWTVPQWLEFDWRAGWGTDAFEDAIADGRLQYHFPPTWAEVDDRYDAREIVDANLKKLRYKHELRKQLLENGSQLDGPFFNQDPLRGQPLRFRYCITNLNPGHNMPSGSLGAQPQIWLNVVLIDPAGNRIWESGYLDSNGDLADNHSLDVLARKVPLDTQLVNFQTKFLTTNVKGTDREMYLPVNFDFDQLPFLRPPQQPVSVINHPPFIRMEGHSIPPLGKRNAKFSVPGHLIQAPGTYRLSVRMRSRAEPIYFMRFCNATTEMQRMMNEWICDFHTSTVTFEVR